MIKTIVKTYHAASLPE